MEQHRLYSDHRLLSALEMAALDPAVFTHEAHLRWGWLLLEKNPAERAIEKACAQLKAYTAFLGASDKYNETVTVAAMKAIRHFRQRVPADTFDEFLEGAPKLKTSLKS